MWRIIVAAGALAAGTVSAEAGQPPRSDSATRDPSRLQEAARAVDAVDFARAARDPAYARSILGHIDTVAPLVRDDAGQARRLDAIRALMLGNLDRKPEAAAIVERLLAAAPAEPGAYLFIFNLAGGLQEPALMVRGVEGVARTLGSTNPAQIFAALSPEHVFSLSQMLRERNLTAERVRLAEALIAMSWQRADPAKLDSFRLFLLNHRLGEGRRDEAANLAREVSGSSALLELLMRKKYDGLIGEGESLMRNRLEEEDRGTASLLAAAPTDSEIVLERISYLRRVGRNEDALALARPWLADVPAAVRRGEHGSWIVNGGADALVALGRDEEARQAMRALAALDPADHSGRDLISTGINHAGMLWQTGRAEESVAQIARLGPLAQTHASEYGRLWIASHAVCANMALDRRAAAEAKLREILPRATINGAAANQALLCMNDLEGSERLMIERLGSDEPDEALLAVQDFAIQSPAGTGTDMLRARLRQVRERPAVRAAIDRVGRILTLPLDRAYQGTF